MVATTPFFPHQQPDIDRLLIEQSRERRRDRESKRLSDRNKSFHWLARVLRLPASFDFKSMLLEMGAEGTASFYHPPRVINKGDGGIRIIITPKAELRMVQKAIKYFLKRTFKRNPNSFGYLGGSCQQLATRHAEYRSTLKFDVRDAFFTVYRKRLITSFQHDCGLSKTVSYWLALLCTYNPPPEVVQKKFPWIRTFLPQGSPTSPICFDIACQKVDGKLGRLAERVGGRYSRFADNYFFSMPTPTVSRSIEKMVVCDAEQRGVRIHKLRKTKPDESCRVLGLNIRDGKVTNSKTYRRKLRGALYVLRSRLERGLDYEESYSRVRGLMGFTVNLPPQLQAEYNHCESLVEQRLQS